jgi:hypothetical protein
MSPGLRFAANGLLPLGCWLVLLLVDAWLASAALSVIVFAGFGVIGYARQYVAILREQDGPR